MSKEFAQKIINEIHTKSSDPNDQLRRVINMCAAEGVTEPITTVTEPAKPPDRPDKPTRAARRSAPRGEVSGGLV